MPYQESEQNTCDKTLSRALKKVPYQKTLSRIKQNTLSKDLIKNLKKVPY